MSSKTNVGESQRLNGLQIGLIALNVLLRVYAAFFMIISDCDETFNYWEPLNLLIFVNGMSEKFAKVHFKLQL